ncbi:MAG TPA: hypothetical protein VFO05_15850 [Candidatus Limnocylindrales bacterium]|nr:hypothetical protein [Candidatus Limnocylindrales bacterium]
MIGIVVNVVLRASMLAMLAAVTRAGRDDPRYVGKGIGVRFGLVAMPSSLLVPALWLRGRGRRRAAGLRPDPYPFWMDDLWISLLALDLAGNVLDLYDRYTHFDLIPHAHGTGALTVTVAWLLRLPPRRAVAVASVLHGLLEVQEYASDKAFGFRNVRGWWDVAGDLSAGAVGSVAYAIAYEHLVRGSGREAASPLSRVR